MHAYYVHVTAVVTCSSLSQCSAVYEIYVHVSCMYIC